MIILGIAGWSGSGKTTLIERLIPLLQVRGLVVSVLKHAHHGFDLDTPGKDSWRHREAGACEVLVSSARRWALLHEVGADEEPGLEQLVSRLSPCDLVLVEGFKREAVPRIEVRREARPAPLLAPTDPWIIAIASDRPLEGEALPVLDLNDAPALAGFVMAWLEQGGRAPGGAALGEREC